MSGHRGISANREDHALIARAIEGDRVALERLLLADYARLARHVASKLPAGVREVVTAEDILQQTFLQAFRDIGNFKARSEQMGWKQAVRDRDEGTFDWTTSEELPRRNR